MWWAGCKGVVDISSTQLTVSSTHSGLALQVQHPHQEFVVSLKLDLHQKAVCMSGINVAAQKVTPLFHYIGY